MEPCTRRAGWAFFGAVALLGVNDWLLKGAGVAPGWLTGKLSDFAGLAAAPPLLALVLRGCGVARRTAALVACALIAAGFSALKLSPALAACFDRAVGAVLRCLDPELGSRTIADTADLIALPALVLGHWLAVRLEPRRTLAMRAGLVCAALLCLATSAPATLVGPHWGFADNSERVLHGVPHGMLELRVGRASLEGSFELGIALYAHDAELVLPARRITAWLDGRRVPARMGSGAPRDLVVAPRGAGATHVYFALPVPADLDALRRFDSDFPERDGRVAIPLQIGATTTSFEAPLVFRPRDLRGQNADRFWSVARPAP